MRSNVIPPRQSPAAPHSLSAEARRDALPAPSLALGEVTARPPIESAAKSTREGAKAGPRLLAFDGGY